MLVQTQEHIKVKTPALLCDLGFVQLYTEIERYRERGIDSKITLYCNLHKGLNGAL